MSISPTAAPDVVSADLSFEQKCATYTTLRQSMVRMSLLDIQLKAERDIDKANELLGQYDRAADQCLAANATLELAGMWRDLDETYLRTDQLKS